MILKSLILIFSIHVWGGPQFPPCFRPKDFSAPGALLSFERCQNKQRAYCDKFEKDTRCRVFLKNPMSYLENNLVNDNCVVDRKGQYRCKEKPVRFFEKGVMPQPTLKKQVEENEPAATPTPSPSPTASGAPATGATPSPN